MISFIDCLLKFFYFLIAIQFLPYLKLELNILKINDLPESILLEYQFLLLCVSVFFKCAAWSRVKNTYCSYMYLARMNLYEFTNHFSSVLKFWYIKEYRSWKKDDSNWNHGFVGQKNMYYYNKWIEKYFFTQI